MAMSRTFVRRSVVDAPASELFAWHARPGAFERLVPPWERIDLIEQTDGIRDGSRVVLRMRAGPFPVKWVAVHEGYREGSRFVDRQVSGPFRLWVHEHRFEEAGERSVLEDRIEYALPLEPLSRWIAGRSVRTKLARTFAWRHATTVADLAAHRGSTPLRIAVSGSHPLLRPALIPFLTTGGHAIVSSGTADALIDFGAPDTAARARELGVRVVVTVSTGAVLDLAGVRVVHLRLGAVLPGERSGDSWIARDDALGAILHAVRCESLSGPVEAAAPGSGRPSEQRSGRLLESGYRYRTPGLEETRRLYLGRMRV